jgi:hypothetical protein
VPVATAHAILTSPKAMSWMKKLIAVKPVPSINMMSHLLAAQRQVVALSSSSK